MASSTSGVKPYSISIRMLLALLCLALLLPVLGFIVYTFNQYADERIASQRVRIAEIAGSVAANANRELSGLLGTANALASSPTLQAGDIAAFYSEAQQNVRQLNVHVLVIDPGMQILMHTREPLGAVLPKTSAAESVAKVFIDGKPQISPVFMGKITKRRVFDVTVPVTVDGAVKYALILASEPLRFERLLAEQGLSAQMHAAVFDSRQKLAAATEPEIPVATQDALLALPDSGVESILSGQDLAYAALQPVGQSGWRAAVWTPQEALAAPLDQLWRNLLWAGLVAAAMTTLLVYAFSLPLRRLVHGCAAKAEKLGSAPNLPKIASWLREGRSIDATLSSANAALLSRQREAQAGKSLLDTLLLNVPEGITIVGGTELTVIANSRRAIELTGRDPGDLKVGAEAHAQAFGISRLDGTIPRPDQLPLFRASRHGEMISGERYVMTRPDSSKLTIEVSVNPYFDSDGDIAGAVSCWRDVTESYFENQKLTESERRLRLALTVADMAIVDSECIPGGSVHVANGPAVLGVDLDGMDFEKAHAKFLHCVHEADRARVAQANMDAAKALGPFADEFRMVRENGDIRWIEVRGECLRLADGSPGRQVSANVNITARKLLEQQLRLISRELTHRVKNVLTVVQGVLTQTARTATDKALFVSSVSNRLQGLAASHDLLVNSNWSGTSLEALIKAQLQAFGGVDGKRITAEGPEILLKVDVMQNLGMALHELGTNAFKYGALSTQDGRIRIRWTARGGRLKLSWEEQGGPPVSKPKREGFGHVVMVRSLARVIYGDVEIKFRKGGVVWTADAPLEAMLYASEMMRSTEALEAGTP